MTRIQLPPLNSDAFYVRLLLVDGGITATSWEELKTVDNIVYTSFSEAAKERGLLQDETTAYAVFKEALTSEWMTPTSARVLLLAVCFHSSSCTPLSL